MEPQDGRSFDVPYARSFQSRQLETGDPDYQSGLRQLQAQEWEKAAASFAASAERRGASADGALYWEAFAQNHLGQMQAALATLAELHQEYAASRWLNDAKALELEVRTQAGAAVNPTAQPDEELKLLALNSLMQSDPERALPVLEKLLASNNSIKVKDRALFILTQKT